MSAGNEIRATNIICDYINGAPSSTGGGLLIDVAANTVPTSTSTTAGATANSLTNVHNKLVGQIPTLIYTDLAANTAPTSTSTNSIATPNSVTNAYNKAVSLIPTVPGFTDLSPNTAPTSTSTNSIATPNSVTNAYNKAIGLIPALSDYSTFLTPPTNTSTTTAATPNSIYNVYRYITTNSIPNATIKVDVAANTAPTSTSTSSSATANSLTNAYNYIITQIPALTDLAISTPPTSTSTTTAATANSLTKAYNYLQSQIPALTDLAVSTPPTSTSTTTAATANSLTNAYNNIKNTEIPAAANHGTTATGAVTLGSTSQTLTIQGSATGTSSVFNNLNGGTVNIGSTAVSNGTINIGNTGTNYVSVNLYRVGTLTGSSTQTCDVYGTTTSGIINLCKTMTTGTLNIATACTGAATINLGTSGFTTTNINGTSVVYGGIAGNVSSTATIASATYPLRGQPMVLRLDLTTEFASVTAPGTPATWIRIPNPWKILGVRASLYTASSSGAVQIDIRYVASGTAVPTSTASGTSIFTTALTIDATKFSSVGSTTPAVLTTAANTTGLADDTGISFFVTAAGTGAAGLRLWLYYSVF